MIEVRGIGYHYPEGGPVLKDVSFDVAEGEKVVLVGANGSGKTTLLQVMNGLIQPQAGSLRYRGELVTPRRLRAGPFNRRFRKDVVLLFQHPDSMLFNPTVYEEIAWGLRQLGTSDLDEHVHDWAARLGVEHQLSRPPFQLSGGEKQRVCLAALLALQPKLLLLDEPTANLDPRATGWLIDFLRDLPVSHIATTHDLRLATELGQRILVLSEAHELIFDGDVEVLLADEETLLAANLVYLRRRRHGTSGDPGAPAHDWS